MAGLAAGLTLLFLGMRAVMDVGGACAEGGAFEIRQRCPTGVSTLFVVAINGGLVFLGLYIWAAAKAKAPILAAYAWPALFLSLGWNFFEYAFDPPGGGGIAWWWFACGVMFLVVGGFPVAVIIPAWRRTVREERRRRRDS